MQQKIIAIDQRSWLERVKSWAIQKIDNWQIKYPLTEADRRALNEVLRIWADWGPQTEPFATNVFQDFQHYTQQTLGLHPSSFRAPFFQIIKQYYEDQIPSANALKDRPFPLVRVMGQLTHRCQLWTQESLVEFRDLLLVEVIQRHLPNDKVVFIEVAAGPGDLSLNLRKMMPGYRFVATDINYDDLYNQSRFDERGIKKFDIFNIPRLDLRSEFALSQDSRLVIIAANLDGNTGLETVLLEQQGVNDLVMVETMSRKGRRRYTGDKRAPVRKNNWTESRFQGTEDYWFSTVIPAKYGPGRNIIRILHRD